MAGIDLVAKRNLVCGCMDDGFYRLNIIFIFAVAYIILKIYSIPQPADSFVPDNHVTQKNYESGSNGWRVKRHQAFIEV